MPCGAAVPGVIASAPDDPSDADAAFSSAPTPIWQHSLSDACRPAAHRVRYSEIKFAN